MTESYGRLTIKPHKKAADEFTDAPFSLLLGKGGGMMKLCM